MYKRQLLEYYGARVDYIPDVRGIKAYLGGSQLDMSIDNNTYGLCFAQADILEGYCTFERTEKPFIYNNRVVAPVRLISELLGGDVKWDEANKTIYISNIGKRFLAPKDAVSRESNIYFSKIYQK